MSKGAPAKLVDLPEEELAELLALVEGSDSVELKLTIPDADQRATVEALGLDPLEAQIRQVFFFDTPDLALNGAGVVARARRVQGREHDSVVKLRPVVPDQLSPELRSSPAFNVEVDAMPGGYVCSATMKGRVGTDDIAEAVAGRLKIHKLFGKDQRAFFRAHAPDGLEIDDLSVMGPIFVLKLKTAPEGFPTGKLVSEAWLYPDGTRILELSTKCPPAQMFDTAVRARAHLAKLGVNLSGEQQTKTKTALEFFSARR
jgi:hypothetical protein